MTRDAALVVLAFLACGFGPGLVLVQRTAWSGPEKLAGSFAASLVLVYLASFGIYLSGLPLWAHWIVVVLAACGLVWTRRDINALARDTNTRRLVALGAIAAAWTVGAVALTRNFSGGGWFGDWVEHWERVLFFLDRWPLQTRFLERFHASPCAPGVCVELPARPPLMNLVAAHFRAVLGPSFAVHQLVFALLGLACVFPVYLLAARFAGPGRRPPLAVMAAAILFNPLILANAIYPWTKLLAASFVALGCYFYLMGRDTGERPRMAFAALSLGAAVATHYSAAPYVVGLGLHWALRERRTFALGASLVALPLAPFLLWSLARFGLASTFGANTTVSALEGRSVAGGLGTVVANIFDTVVPHPFRMDLWAQLSGTAAARLHDYTFLIYQTNGVLALGAAGGALVLAQMLRSARRAAPADRLFWTMVMGSGVILGTASHSPRDLFGVAHIVLQPLVLMGLAYLAGSWPNWSPAWRALAIGGWVVDLALGIALPLRMQALTFYDARTTGLGWGADWNWGARILLGLDFLGDKLATVRLPIAGLLLAGAMLLLIHLGAGLRAPAPAARTRLDAARGPG